MTDPIPVHRKSDWGNSHPATWPEERLLAHCLLSFSRSSGPGGQNRNKVETSVVIEYLPAKIIASASERRTQNENRKVALQRLRCKLAVELRSSGVVNEPVASSFIPSAIWQEYCHNGKIDVSDTNVAWPAILTELMRALTDCDWNLSNAAILLHTSSSQLVKLLKKYAPAFSLLNQERALRGHRSLD